MSYITTTDLSSVGGLSGGGLSEDMLQPNHHVNNVDTSDMSMYQWSLQSNQVTTAPPHQHGTTSTSAHTFNAMHTELVDMMRHEQSSSHELPLENHKLVHHDDQHPHQHLHRHEQDLYNLTNLQQMYNNPTSQLGPISTTTAVRSSQSHSVSGLLSHDIGRFGEGSQTSADWISAGSAAYEGSHGQYLSGLSSTHPQPSQSSGVGVQNGSYNSQQALGFHQHIHSGGGILSGPPTQLHTQHSGGGSKPQQLTYSASTATSTASHNNAPPSSYDFNLKFTTDHFAALNLHGVNSEGGGGFLGGLLMGAGATNSAVPGGVPGGPPSSLPGGVMEDEVRQQSVSSDSQAYYGNETIVKELRPAFVRWLYRYEQDRKWKPFTGYDSIRIERKYREVYRGQLASYSHNTYYPVASSNDESTDFSKFVQNQQQPPGGGGVGSGFALSSLNNNNNNNQTPMSSQVAPSRFSDMMQYKWWPGKGMETTVDTEFNNGGIGFPPSIRNNSVGGSTYLPSAIKGRMAPNNKEKMLQKANSASALLSGHNNGSYENSNPTSAVPKNLDLTKVIIVREGLYEVDLETFTCFSTYWPGDTCIITRGTWFYDGTWDPLPVDQAEKLEEAHMGKFCGASLINIQNVVGQTEEERKAGQTAPAIHRVSFTDFHVDWTSPTDVHWYSTAASSKFMRSVGQKLGFADWGQRLCRGYFKPASIVDRPSEISHIVFVIHGIGHKMDTGRIVRNCSAFRECVATMKEKYFPQLTNAKHRAEFFPVEWRSAAKLDGDIVEAITPQKLLTLRQLLNSTAMDIMYYTSPLYRAEIQNALRDELNRIYSNFVKRNPNFTRNGGKVSVMAHSLGAIITYDIMTGYLSSADNEIGIQHRLSQGLLFNLEHFFCLGSPLSVFLALRWREPQDPNLRTQILPHHLCKRLYNVFYSSDPVAYRLEPLLNRHYVRIAPVTIHSYNAPMKPRYAEMPRELITKEMNVTKTASDNTTTASLPVPLDASSASQKISQMNRTNFIPSSLKSPPSPTKDTNNWGTSWFPNIKKYWKGSTSPAAPESYVVATEGPVGVGVGELSTGPGPVDDGSFLQNKENYSTVVDEEPLHNIPNDLEYRLDFVLRESQFSGSSYIAALTSHTSYWNSPDAAYFVMTHLYDDLIEQAYEER